MVDGLGQTQLEDLRLQAALEKILSLQAQHEIELHLRFVQHADADEAAKQRIAFEQPTRIFVFEREKFARSLENQIRLSTHERREQQKKSLPYNIKN